MATKTRPGAPASVSVKKAEETVRLLKQLRTGRTLILTEARPSKGKKVKLRAVALQPGAISALIRYYAAAAEIEVTPAAPAPEKALSTSEAAALLGMSRPFLTGLIDRGEISAYKVGAHRRLLKEDVLAYKAARSKGRKRALAEMARLAQEHDVGYGDSE